MKVKNLLLAGLVAVAMSACSNETENGSSVDNLAKDAKMQLVISLPTATSTRAVDDGIAVAGEEKINDLTVVVVNNGSTVVKFYTAAELSNGTEDFAGIKNTTPAFDVTSGKDVTVYAYANYGEGVITASNYSNLAITGKYTDKGNNGLTLLEKIANLAASNFYMSGSETGVKIEAGKTDNRAIVKISRISAKITEKTTNKDFKPEALDKNPTIKLTDYTLFNLGTQTTPLTDPATTAVYNKNAGVDNNDCAVIWEDNQTPSLPMTSVAQSTYCLANLNSDITLKTRIAYKAKIKYADGVADADGTFYVRKDKDGAEKVYSLASLKAAYKGTYDAFNESTATKTWFENGVLKYTNGISYYKKDITTDGASKIVRNNVYLVNVTKINGLGTPELDMPEVGDLTMLTVEVRVQPWVIQKNDITLE